ncbi:MAG: hypothetical protein Q8L68_06585 [Methylococcales bacterium]|nr:hypothetical protein [Methylococcales bacterium]
MALSSIELEKITEGGYTFEFLKIILTQMKEDAPIEYFGSGSVLLTKDGTLELKMYHLSSDIDHAFKEIKSLACVYPSLGKIISRDNYFSMRAYDLNGNEWNAEYLRLNSTVSFPLNGRVITAEIKEIVNSEKIEITGSVKLLVLTNGKLEFPWNSYQKTNESFLLSECKISRDSFSWNAHKSENDITQISATFEVGYANENSSKLFLEALSIALGKYIHPVVWMEIFNNQKITKVCSRQKQIESKSVEQPIPTSSFRSGNPLDIAMFVENYLAFFSEPNSPMFGYWYRILDSANNNVENQALIITTTIEGVLKKYFKELGKPDLEFAAQAEQAKEIVGSLDIGTRVKDSILKSLNANGFTAKNALHKLHPKNVVTTDMIKVWSVLRNKYAHAGQLKHDDAEIQLIVDQIYCCIGVFYILLLLKLNYTGTFINYSKAGWPEELFPSKLNSD